MNFFRRLLLLIIIIQLLQSCNEDKRTHIYNKTYTIKQVKDKIIKLDTMTNPWQINYDLHGESFFVFSDLENTLQEYNWNTGQLISKKKLPKEGPNGIRSVSSIMVKNIDSIFIVSGFAFKLSLLDKDFKIRNRWSLLNQKKASVGSGMFAKGRFGFWDNNIYLGGYPFIDREDERFYSEGITSLSVNLKNNKIQYLTKSPPSYIEKFKQGYFILPQQIDSKLTFNYQKKQMIISYITEDNIEVVDLINNKSRYHYAGSDEIKDFIWAKKSIIEDRKKRFDFLIKQPQFSSICYDKYRKMYYRVFEKTNPSKIDEYDDQPWTIPSIIILNENFEKIGETEISKKYSLTSIIIRPEGPYMRKYVKEEDKMVFTLFKLVKL